MSYQFSATAIPGSSGVTSAAKSEADAKLEAYSYAMLFLDNDPKRSRVEVTINRVCFACNGAGRYQVKGKRSLFGNFKDCAVCKNDPLEVATYAVTRE